MSQIANLVKHEKSRRFNDFAATHGGQYGGFEGFKAMAWMIPDIKRVHTIWDAERHMFWCKQMLDYSFSENIPLTETVVKKGIVIELRFSVHRSCINTTFRGSTPISDKVSHLIEGNTIIPMPNFLSLITVYSGGLLSISQTMNGEVVEKPCLRRAPLRKFLTGIGHVRPWTCTEGKHD